MTLWRGSALLALACCLFAGSPRPELLWEKKLADAHPLRHDVQGLRFSWDGKWLAAVLVHLRTEDSAANDLVLAPVDGDEAGIKRMTVKEELLSSPEHPGIHWSPGGDYLALETKHFSTILVRLADRERCVLPRTTVFGGFIAPDRVLAADWEPPKDPAMQPAKMSSVTIYDLQCRAVETTRWNGEVRALEPYSPGGLLAVSPEQSEVRVMEVGQARVTHQLPNSPNSVLRWGDSGKALCRGGMPGRGLLECWDLTTGEQTWHREVQGGAPLDVSASSSVVVATAGTSFDTGSGIRWRLSRWVIWDYKTNRDLAKLDYFHPRRGYDASPAAISPDGQRLAIGVEDRVRMYKIPQ